jgi:ribonucleoside-diphosphate reductase alpha chain
LQILKRSGEKVPYDQQKIIVAMEKAFQSVGQTCTAKELKDLVARIEQNIFAQKDPFPSVEFIQDQVEKALMKAGHFEAAKSYILYRQERTRRRLETDKLIALFPEHPEVTNAIHRIRKSPGENHCPLDRLYAKLLSFKKEAMPESELVDSLIRAAAELTTPESPKWEFAAAQLLLARFERQLKKHLKNLGIAGFYDKLRYLTHEGLYGAYILENYSREELDQAYSFIVSERNELFTYSGLDLMLSRYVVRSRQGEVLETPQEMFLGVALHLAMPEKNNRMQHVRDFYDMLSTLKVTMATPTLSNARKPYHQLSSCFIDTVPDSLNGIYRSVDNFAKVSKLGGGMGLYFGKVRATGSSIRGFEGAAGGVIRWIRLVNDTAVAVDQLGMRQGAVAVYLDVWHRDLPEFLQLRTNNGDDRMKAHDVFPAVCYPDYFWQQVRDNINGDWYLMCPYEIKQAKGYNLEDSWGEEWTRRYLSCVEDMRIHKRVIPIKDVVRLVIKSLVETGTPFVFNRDTVNRMNPNGDKGMIYCSNLCTEIAQNMSAIQTGEQTVEKVNGENIVVTRTVAGDFVVCNLASLSLGHIDVENETEVEQIVTSVVRALDNVIDLNYYPLPYARITSQKYRSLGLGVSGYHHMLAKRGIPWESQEHLDFVGPVFERINYYAVKASNALAKEKGRYKLFNGSDWQTGAYFDKRDYTSDKWLALRKEVSQHGIRNAYLMAIAPTSSTSIISGTSPGVDPIMNRFFYEEKKQGLMPRVAPELSPQTFWLYKSAHTIDQNYSIKACGIRQRHIDQAISMNLYITNDYTFRQLLNLYLLAWKKGVKTIYYVRSKSLEIEECTSCSS